MRQNAQKWNWKTYLGLSVLFVNAPYVFAQCRQQPAKRPQSILSSAVLITVTSGPFEPPQGGDRA
jgi:hypothetical protein